MDDIYGEAGLANPHRVAVKDIMKIDKRNSMRFDSKVEAILRENGYKIDYANDKQIKIQW